MNKPFYITTTLPYVNSDPHIGFAMELIRADIIARYKKLQGYEVFMNTGTDEHGVKIFRKAKENNVDTQAYVDEYAQKFKNLISLLGISPDINFIRTTDEHHIKAAQEFWKIADKNGLIYKKNYSVKYCIGCELEKTESELVDGKCPLHPLQELEIIEEENYFFRFSLYQKPLLDLYSKNEDFVVPKTRLNEIKAFVERGLDDFSISRLASKMPWGIPVPNDPNQVMYVWFDALVNYVSAVGWPTDQKQFEKFWVQSGGVVQYCGKDNLRQQAAMWQAMLMAVRLPPSKQIIINGFVTGEGGIKMSKSLGNTIDPFSVVKDYGTDALRFYVCREVAPFEDSPFTMDLFKDSYNAYLANGIGNLVSRVMKMAVTNEVRYEQSVQKNLEQSEEFIHIYRQYSEGFTKYNLQQSINAIIEVVANTDKIIQEKQPFKKIKTDKEAGTNDIKDLLARLNIIAVLLEPILPNTSKIMVDLIINNQVPQNPLFLRK